MRRFIREIPRLKKRNRGRIALSPSQPGLNPRSSDDNRTHNCFFKNRCRMIRRQSRAKVAMIVPRLAGISHNSPIFPDSWETIQGEP